MTLRVDSRPAIAEFPVNSSRERPALHGVGAEGATAPETLRQTDREELMNAGKQPAVR
jgi:hypothetical protein